MPETLSTEFAALPVIPEAATRYEVLEVGPKATAEELRIAYRRLALLYHPDRHPEVDRERASEVFKRIAAAYATLSDLAERRRYDAALESGEEFNDCPRDGSEATLADILSGIDAYEHIFSAEKLRNMSAKLTEIVTTRLLTGFHEQIVGVWKMTSAPAGVRHPGSYTEGAVVLTTIRLLLPYTFSWEETRGSTKYRYTGAEMLTFVLPLVQRITIILQGWARPKLWVEIQCDQETTRFRPGHAHLGKLLLIARLWGIAVESRCEEERSMDWRWALLSPWKWAIGVLTAAIGFLAGVGIVAGGIVDNPLWLVDTMTKYGLWQWYSVVWALVSAWRTWHCGRLYYAVPLRPAQDGTAVGGTERQEISTVAR